MKKNKFFCYIMIVFAVICSGIIIFLTARACHELGDTYGILKSRELVAEDISLISYDDNMYAVLAYGNNDPDMKMADYLENSLRNIDERIMAAGLLYVAVISAMLVYPVYFFSNKKRIISTGLLTVAACYLLFVLFVITFMVFNKVPFYFPTGSSFLLSLIGLISLFGGYSALSTLIRVFKFKKVVAVSAFIVVFTIYLMCCLVEGGLYCDPYQYDFNFLLDIDSTILDEDYEGDLFIDNETMIAHLNGQEYPAERYENAEYFRGAARVMAVGEELINPYSAVSIDMVIREYDVELPLGYAIMYIVKALLWIFVPLFVIKKEKTEDLF